MSDEPRVLAECKEMCPRTAEVTGISGFLSEFTINGGFPTTTESISYSEGGKETSEEEDTSVCEDSFPHNREDDSVNTSCEPGTIVLQGFSMTPLPDPEEGRLQIRQFSPSDRGSHEGPTMVGLVSDDFQQEGHSPPTDRYDNRIRCLHQGMGSILSGEISRRTVEMGGVEVSHQHPAGAESCLPRPTDISPQSEEHTGASPNRQQNGDSLYQSQGRNSFQTPLGSSDRDMAMVHGQRYQVYSSDGRAHCGEREHTSGQGIQDIPGPRRLETTKELFPLPSPDMGSSRGRPVCRSPQPSTPHLLQLSSGPGSLSSRRICPELIGWGHFRMLSHRFYWWGKHSRR